METRTEESERGEVKGEKEPGIEWRIGLGNTRGECGAETGLGVDRSKRESRGVDPLGVGSGSRIEVSGSEGVCVDDAFLTKRPVESLGGNLVRFGIQLVTQGDR